MNLVLCMCVLFSLGSMMGWVIELLFRRFVSTKKWINPGFLVGPCLPLYGFGLVGLFILSYYLRFDTWFGLPSWANAIIVILIMTIVMTLIEYIAGLIFIKGMGIKLWDYSDRWGNIQGIICPLFTLFWGIIAAFFYFHITGICANLLDKFRTDSLTNAWLPFILGMFYGILLIDLWYSLKLTRRIKEFAKEHNVVVRYEELKLSIRETQLKAKQKINYLLPFKSDTSMKEHLENYLEKLNQKKDDLVSKAKDRLNKNKKNKED